MHAGAVAVELALILPVMFILMFAMFQFGRIFWQYNAMQKAATDAARLLAAMPSTEWQDLSKVNGARAQAQQLVADAASDASIHPDIDPTAVAVTLYCGANGSSICTYSNNLSNQVTAVTVGFDLGLTDDGFYDFGPAWSAWVTNINIHVESTMPASN